MRQQIGMVDVDRLRKVMAKDNQGWRA